MATHHIADRSSPFMPAETLPRNEEASSTTTCAPGPADYDAIFAAVMQTERGRWFLAEYARHNRRADTAEVLAAINSLAAMMRPVVAHPHMGKAERSEFGGDIDRLRAELADMANAIARTKNEIASIRPDAAQGGRILEATEQLDSVLRTTERATSDILAAAEQVQEVAWTMREQDVASEFCDRLDGYATEIYTACSFQDLTGQRTRKIIQVLRYLEARIQAMTDIWGAANQARSLVTAATEPAFPAGHLSQNDLDRLMAPRSAVESPNAVPALKSPVVDPVAGAKPTAPPTTAPEKATKSTLTIEGPSGSFSILSGRTVEPSHAISPFDAAPPPAETDPLTAGLRAFAANLMAESRKQATASQDNSVAVAAPAPPATPARTSNSPVCAPAPSAIAPRQSRQPENVLPLAVAPPLGDLPQRPALESAPSTRKSDVTEDLFTDVMALTDEERIALFT